ncbi:MAG TPA: hypothetical protein VNU64_24970 [Burkholderiales bacterium]|nr:hypothetical protein [Burkholderiales bacterium]
MNAPTEREIAEYRAMLAELMQRCLESIRAVKLPDDAEPFKHDE